jgi:hypothetical protein
MKLAALMCLGVSSCLAVTTAHHAHAQGPAVKALTYIGTIAVTTYMGIRSADAAKKQEAQAGAVSSPSPPGSFPGKIFKLGPEWRAVTSAGYCVSYSPGLCSPCDLDGSFCGGHADEEVLQIAQ